MTGVQTCALPIYEFIQTVRLDELIALLERALGKPSLIDRQPLQPGDVPVTYADISKARRLLGYDPKTKIADGIPKFVAWFRGARSGEGQGARGKR